MKVFYSLAPWAVTLTLVFAAAMPACAAADDSRGASLPVDIGSAGAASVDLWHAAAAAALRAGAQQVARKDLP